MTRTMIVPRPRITPDVPPVRHVPKGLTWQVAFDEIRRLGYTLRHDPALREYTLRRFGSSEVLYHTPDRLDAVHTARDLANRRGWPKVTPHAPAWKQVHRPAYCPVCRTKVCRQPVTA